MFLILYYPTKPILSVVYPFAPFCEVPEVYLSKYSQTAILRSANFRRVNKHNKGGQVQGSGPILMGDEIEQSCMVADLYTLNEGIGW